MRIGRIIDDFRAMNRVTQQALAEMSHALILACLDALIARRAA